MKVTKEYLEQLVKEELQETRYKIGRRSSAMPGKQDKSSYAAHTYYVSPATKAKDELAKKEAEKAAKTKKAQDGSNDDEPTQNESTTKVTKEYLTQLVKEELQEVYGRKRVSAQYKKNLKDQTRALVDKIKGDAEDRRAKETPKKETPKKETPKNDSEETGEESED